jgi:hypothetical protein
MEDDLKKQKVGITQQPLVGSFRNLKLMLMGPSQMLWKLNMMTTFNGRRPQKTKCRNNSATAGWILPKFETYVYWTKPNVLEI